MTQFEFYKSFQFVLELLLAETLYVYKLRRRSLFPLRLTVAVALLFLFSWLLPAWADNAFYSSFVFLIIFVASVLLCKAVFKETWLTAAFCCVAGYTTQHIAYETYMLVLNITGANGETPMGFYGSEFVGMFSNPFLAAMYFLVYVLTFFVCFFAFSEKLKPFESVQLKTAFIFVFAIFILIVDIFLNMIVVHYLSSNENVLYLIVVGVYNILCCCVSLYLQFEVALKKKLENTLDTVQRLWHEAKEQYAVSKENIEMINVKCHDLKHQIRTLGKEAAVSSDVLKDIENRISIYDSEMKTGNVALDIILTEKSLQCKRKGVKFSCIVDGEKLNFMAEEDIYALFGNIVDNAIEAVVKADPSKRVISLLVKTVNDLLVVKETNYYDDDIRFVNGIPQTTKPDKQYHGFGIRSIQYICERYGGDLTIKAENNVFELNILFFLEK